MKSWIVGMGLLLTTGSAFAALHPYHERNNLIKDILSEKRVESALTDPSTRGRATGLVDALNVVSAPYGYDVTISSGRCTLNVRAEAKRTHRIGPTEFELKIGKSMNCPPPRR